MKARDRAHYKALPIWARRATEYVLATYAKNPTPDGAARMGMQFCVAKLRWETLGLSSEGRQQIPEPARTRLRHARQTIRNYRPINIDDVVEIARLSTVEIAHPLERLLAEESPHS